LLKRVHCR